jgi:hypothetical protein
MNTLSGHIATRIEVEFEDLIARSPCLHRAGDPPTLAGGWFRLIELAKNS